MSRDVPPRGAPGRSGERRAVGPALRSVPRLVVGLVLLIAGVVWLLDALDLARAQWGILLPAGVVAVGVALMLTARRRDRGGLVALGIVLLVLSLATDDAPLTGPDGAVGAQEVAVASTDDLREELSHGIGDVTVDLRELPEEELGEPLAAEASVGIGQLTVLLPDGLAADVEASAGIGQVVVGDVRRGGLGVSAEESLAGDLGPLRLEASAGIGRVEVRRGP